MAIFTGAGTIVSISKTSTPPATFDEAGYEALESVELGCISEINPFGAVREQVEYTCLSDGQLRRLGGSIDNGTFEVTLQLDDATEGFEIINDAFKDGFTRYITVELPNKQNATGTNAKRYFGGVVLSAPESIGDPNATATIDLVMSINTEIIKVDSTAGIP